MRRLWAAVLAGSLLSVLGSVPASANAGEKITIRIENDDKASKTYPGMLVNDAASEFVADPPTCEKAPFCTLVPMEVLLAEDFDPDINEFVVKVTLSWDDQPLEAGGQQGQGNDLDMYIYHEEKDAKGNTVYVEDARAAGASQPERTKMFTPTRKDYLIVVYNFLGVNSGFKLDLSYLDASIEELPDYDSDEPIAAPSFGGSSSGGFGGSDSEPTFDGSDGALRPTPRSPSFLPSVPDGFTGGSNPMAVPISPEDGSVFDFPGGTGRDLASDLAPGETQDVFKPRVASLNPEPASPALVVFWLGVVPLILVGAAAVFMLRRRPAALTLQLPRTSTA